MLSKADTVSRHKVSRVHLYENLPIKHLRLYINYISTIFFLLAINTCTCISMLSSLEKQLWRRNTIKGGLFITQKSVFLPFIITAHAQEDCNGEKKGEVYNKKKRLGMKTHRLNPQNIEHVPAEC